MQNLKLTYADANEEFIEVDVTIAIGIEKAHKSVGFIARNADLDLTEAGVELLSVDLVVSIERVEVSEGSAEAANRLSTAGLDLRSDALEDCTGTKGSTLGDMLPQMAWVSLIWAEQLQSSLGATALTRHHWPFQISLMTNCER